MIKYAALMFENATHSTFKMLELHTNDPVCPSVLHAFEKEAAGLVIEDFQSKKCTKSLC